MGSLPSTIAAVVLGSSPLSSESAPVSFSPIRKHPMPNSQKWPLGTKVQKHFAGYGTFVGEVGCFEDGLYHIVYSDGDAEDFDEDDMERHLYLVPSPTAVTPFAFILRKRHEHAFHDEPILLETQIGRWNRRYCDTAINIHSHHFLVVWGIAQQRCTNSHLDCRDLSCHGILCPTRILCQSHQYLLVDSR